MKRLLAVVVALLGLAAACSSKGGGGGSSSAGVPKGCETVQTDVSPEKLTLLTDLAQRFNSSGAARQGGCVFVQVRKLASGAGAQLLADGWNDPATNGPAPVIWSPAARSWGAVLNQRLTAKGQAAMAPADARSFMVTPLVIAMPKPMAEAIGWPATPIGWSDILALARDPDGWASKGHPEWGAFKLGKTNPNFSTSGLSSTVAQYYAATGKQSGLTLEDLANPDVDAFMRGVESAVVHYGDTTLTFLNNLYRNDRAGAALTYVSAVAVEETSVVVYNQGNPDGILDPGERPRPPRVPLVAIYPKDGTLFSDNPLFILDAPWVSARQRDGARRFEEFVRQPDNQKRVLQYGFRPGNPQVAIGDPITPAMGLDPNQPTTTLGVPDPAVLVGALDRWAQQRKGAKVMLVVDVSGSMGEEVADGETKLDLAKRAASDAIDQFKADDLVALRMFSTGVGPREHTDYLDLVPFGARVDAGEQIKAKLATLVPRQGTPLYSVAQASYADLKGAYDPARINAIVLLTDGRNEATYTDLDATIAALRAGAEGQSSSPVRLFTIAYGKDADKATLRSMAEATNGAAYDASDPSTIANVFTAVVSNF